MIFLKPTGYLLSTALILSMNACAKSPDSATPSNSGVEADGTNPGSGSTAERPIETPEEKFRRDAKGEFDLPSGVSFEDEIITTSFSGTSTKIYVRKFIVPNSAGLVIYMHGALENGGRSNHLVEFMTRSGLSVIVPDHRGHGLSQGEQAYVDFFSEYTSDFSQVVKVFANRYSNKSIFIMGQSMGGLVSFMYGANRETRPANIKAFALLSPALGGKFNFNPHGAGLTATPQTVPIVGHNRFNASITTEDLMNDPVEMKRFDDNSSMFHFTTIGMSVELIGRMGEVGSIAGGFKYPLLIATASDDHLVDIDKVKEVFNQVPNSSGRNRYEILPNTKHDLLNSDTGTRERIYREALDFFIQSR